MIEVGRLCIKIAGRDSGMKGVIVDVINDTYVLVDGQLRRKKCNIRHLEPLNTLVKITKNASHEEVVQELKKIGINVKEKVAKERKKEAKPKAAPTKKKVSKKK